MPTHDPVANLARYFSEKKALSKDTAVEVSTVDWAAMGFAGLNKRPAYKFIKEDNGKFWLDEEELQVFNEKGKEKLKWFWFIIALWVVICAGLAIYLVFMS